MSPSYQTDCSHDCEIVPATFMYSTSNVLQVNQYKSNVSPRTNNVKAQKSESFEIQLRCLSFPSVALPENGFVRLFQPSLQRLHFPRFAILGVKWPLRCNRLLMGNAPEGGERALGHCDFWACRDADILRVYPAVQCSEAGFSCRTVDRQSNIHTQTSTLLFSCTCCLILSLRWRLTDELLMS